jgi:hypothetical protein
MARMPAYIAVSNLLSTISMQRTRKTPPLNDNRWTRKMIAKLFKFRLLTVQSLHSLGRYFWILKKVFNNIRLKTQPGCGASFDTDEDCLEKEWREWRQYYPSWLDDIILSLLGYIMTELLRGNTIAANFLFRGFCTGLSRIPLPWSKMLFSQKSST